MDLPILHTLVERLRADERLPAFAEALPTRARVAEPALPLLLAALHEELGRGLCVLLPEDTDARDAAEAARATHRVAKAFRAKSFRSATAHGAPPQSPILRAPID